MHLADATALDFVQGRLDEPGIEAVEEHLDSCPSCRKVIAEVSRALAATGRADGSSEEPVLAAGSLVQRYRIEEVLGRGAMGVVYAARDPDLDRRIALKLLRADVHGDGRERMIREARAMAQLDHPNVVAVYDVGPVDGRGDSDETYIAMELVDGVTLRAWTAARKRPWREVLEVLIGAGRGLAAAHQAGVCHRDFKPDNVMVGNDGRARVGDFGLASGGGEAALDGRSPALAVTQSGMVLGTPLYMAPERIAGAAAEPRGDQFSYAVTLFEALHGRRPFEGATVHQLHDAMTGGAISGRQARLPAGLRRAVDRGLADDPAARWPSVGAMVDALVAVQGRRARWRRAGAVAGLVAAAAGATAIAVRLGSASPDPCAGVASAIDRVWNPDRAAGLERALATGHLPYAARAAGEVARRADAFAHEWRGMRQAACQAAQQGESAALADRRIACLDRRLSELDALVDVLSSAPAPAAVESAGRAAAAIAPPSQCRDADALLAAVAPPADPATREKIALLRQRLDRALAMHESAAFEPGARLAETILSEARAADYPPLVAEALYGLAGNRAGLGQLADAEKAYDEALELAAAARDHELVAKIWIALVYLVGGQEQRAADLVAMRRAAEAAVAQAGHRPTMRADLAQNLGVALDLAGKPAEAKIEYERALALNRKHRGPGDPRVADALHNLGALAWSTGDLAGATRHYQEALALREARFGPDHPTVGDTLLGLGAVARAQDRLPEARASYQRAVAIFAGAFGEDHARVGAALNNLAIVCELEKRFDEAESNHRRALAIRRATYGAEHPLIAQSLGNLGNLAAARGRLAEARALFEESLAMRERVLPEGHPGRAIGMHNLASALGKQGEHRKALELDQRALAIMEKAGGSPLAAAEMRFGLAQNMWQLNAGRGRAIALAREALAAYRASGATAEADGVATWLAAR